MKELVALDLPAGAGFLDALRAAWDSGDAVLPLNQRSPRSHRRGVAESLGASVVVSSEGRTALPGGRPVEDGDALVVATSGTTGDPKGAVITHASVEYAAFATATALGTEADTHWLACLPLAHVGGLSVVTRALHTGAGLTLQDRFDPDAVQEAARLGATHVSLVPTALARIDPTPWRRILLGGSAMPRALPANAVTTYGMTETFGGVVYDGLALNGVQVRIAGARPGELGVTGEVELRSPTLLRCYRDGSDPVSPDGWYPTGDIGLVEPSTQRLAVLGRADDLIVTGGENVWPGPVEEVLEDHPGVREAAVVGRPDPEWGEVVHAVVVPVDPRQPPVLAELRAFVSARLPVACAPKGLEVVGELPRAALGKLQRRSLADAANDEAAASRETRR